MTHTRFTLKHKHSTFLGIILRVEWCNITHIRLVSRITEMPCFEFVAFIFAWIYELHVIQSIPSVQELYVPV